MKILISEKQHRKLQEQLYGKAPEMNKGFYNPTQLNTIGSSLSDSVELIKKHEGFCDNLKKKCPPYTIGYGTRTDLHPELKGKKIDDTTATSYIKKDLESYVIPAIKRLVKVPLNDQQTAALCSLIYNIGAGNFAKSKLLKHLNLGEMKEAEQQWLDFTKSEGKKLGGLVKRRWDEIKLFFGK